MTDLKLFSVIPYKDHLIELKNPIKAWAYYKSHAIDLLTGVRIDFALSEWLLSLEQKTLFSEEENPRVIHLFYEIGFMHEKKDEWAKEDTLLAIDCVFKEYKRMPPKEFKKVKLKLRSAPSREEYIQAFNKGHSELLDGNCYQFNLTKLVSTSTHGPQVRVKRFPLTL